MKRIGMFLLVLTLGNVLNAQTPVPTKVLPKPATAVKKTARFGKRIPLFNPEMARRPLGPEDYSHLNDFLASACSAGNPKLTSDQKFWGSVLTATGGVCAGVAGLQALGVIPDGKTKKAAAVLAKTQTEKAQTI